MPFARQVSIGRVALVQYPEAEAGKLVVISDVVSPNAVSLGAAAVAAPLLARHAACLWGPLAAWELQHRMQHAWERRQGAACSPRAWEAAAAAAAARTTGSLAVARRAARSMLLGAARLGSVHNQALQQLAAVGALSKQQPSSSQVRKRRLAAPALHMC